MSWSSRGLAGFVRIRLKMVRAEKILAVCALTLSIFGCIGQSDEDIMNLQVKGPEEFKAYIEGNDVFLLDVYGGDQKRIPKTDAQIPYNELKDNAYLLPKDKDHPIAVYCRVNPSATSGSQALFQLGYTNVTKLKGGTTAWGQMGYALE